MYLLDFVAATLVWIATICFLSAMLGWFGGLSMLEVGVALLGPGCSSSVCFSQSHYTQALSMGSSLSFSLYSPSLLGDPIISFG